MCSLPQADNPRSAAVAGRLGTTLLGEATIPPNDRRGELIAFHFVIDRADWLTRNG